MRLAEASVKRKAVFLENRKSTQNIGSNGGLIRNLKTTVRSHLGIYLSVRGHSTLKDLIRLIRSGLWEISMPLEAKRVERADL